MTTELVSLSEFVDGISDYTSQSKNTDRGLKMIYAYNNFLKTPICEEMFTGKNPLFNDFVGKIDRYREESQWDWMEKKTSDFCHKCNNTGEVKTKEGIYICFH